MTRGNKRGVNGDVRSLISLSENIVALGEAIAIYDKYVEDKEERYEDSNNEDNMLFTKQIAFMLDSFLSIVNA